jgi:hypothetical protein
LRALRLAAGRAELRKRRTRQDYESERKDRGWAAYLNCQFSDYSHVCSTKPFRLIEIFFQNGASIKIVRTNHLYLK